MKAKYYTFVALIATGLAVLPAFGQKSTPVSDTIYMGAGYANEIYYSMSAGNKGDIDRKQWDIAFRANIRSASILTNDAANNNSLNVSGVELYTYPKSDTNGWASVDTSNFSVWKKLLVNSPTDWETGAFCRNQLGHPDYGWGRYNSANHDVVGDSLYIIRLRDGSYKKLWVIRKYSGANTYKFRFANLNGTSDTTVLLDCSPYSSKNFIGYSLISKKVVDFEPVVSSSWDLLFTKYWGISSGIPYIVTGTLNNYGIKVNKFAHVPLTYNSFNTSTMDSSRSVIGYDWKNFNFNTQTYDIVDSLVFFVQNHSKNIYKLVFKNFAGSSTGRIVLERSMISALGINDSQKTDVNVAVYPNPSSDVMNVILNPGASKVAIISLWDLTGHAILQKQFELQPENLSTLQIQLPNVPNGLYVLKVQAGSSLVTLKVMVSK